MDAKQDSNIPSGCTIFYSSANDFELGKALGHRHYSYRFAEHHFLTMLQERGVAPTRLPMPEYYGQLSALAAEHPSLGPHPVHLIFRSTDDIRLLKSSYNIACFSWEFEVMKDNSLFGEHPFHNQKRMLRICDEVWAPSQYTHDVLLAHGLENVHRIPAPIAIPQYRAADRYDVLARLAELSVCPLFTNFLISPTVNRDVCASRIATLGEWLASKITSERRPKIYLTVLNPEDFRKNLDAVLRGFHYFASADINNVLIVKALTSQARFPLADVVADVVRAKMAPGTNLESDAIVFLNDYLDEDGLSHLYSLADFYLCAPVAEGQNLPLLEAMAHGVVPVTTRHTAMLDYIADDNAVIIRDREINNDSEHFAAYSAGKSFQICRAEYHDVWAALRTSSTLPESQYRKMSKRCIEVIEQNYSRRRVWDLVASRLAKITHAQTA